MSPPFHPVLRARGCLTSTTKEGILSLREKDLIFSNLVFCYPGPCWFKALQISSIHGKRLKQNR